MRSSVDMATWILNLCCREAGGGGGGQDAGGADARRLARSAADGPIREQCAIIAILMIMSFVLTTWS